MTDLPVICLLFCILPPPAPVVVDSYAQECRIIRVSRTDTEETLRQVAAENARCRTARERVKAK